MTLLVKQRGQNLNFMRQIEEKEEFLRLHTCKENMNGLLLNILEDEDIYVDTATLIQKIAN